LVVAASGVLAVIALAWLLRRRYPGGLTALVTYLVLLAPMHAGAHAGPQLTADRYSYLATLGGAILLGGVLQGLATVPRRRAVALAGVGLLGLGSLSVAQQTVWHDPERLWRHATRVSDPCSVCHQNLGVILQERGDWAAALAEFDRSLAIRPDRGLMHLNRGLALAGLGRLEEAIEEYRLVLRERPDDLVTRSNVAAALVRLGRRGEALRELRRVFEHNRVEAALRYFRADSLANPTRPVLRLGLVLTYRLAGDPDQAARELRELGVLDPPLAGLAVDHAAGGRGVAL
jgi:tetratricopeptide (TPR) repeat protein